MKNIKNRKVKLTFLLCLLLPGFLFAQTVKSKAPNFALGNFTDDYGIKYQITDSVWLQYPSSKYHIIKWNQEKQYLIAKNDSANKTDANRYTRIDYMTFADMLPWKWGFCLTVYDAETDEIAEKTAYVDRQNPKKGCNGYPFSRMKLIETKN
ncbi:MAG: hypothetical protein EOO90_10060 [Pedobacter sp.]|nr:MAG: hypothetical protein EOO90_10060 [Pedobacter sp.]